MKIATWNVNSVRARKDKLLAWLDKADPGILLLQETKVTDANFPTKDVEAKGYHVSHVGQPSYNGVAILSKSQPQDIVRALPGDDHDDQARYVEAVVDGMRVASVYVPNGSEVGSEKFAYKLAWLERLYAHAQALLALPEPLVIGGDYNVAPWPIDVYAPDELDGTVCYHPDERRGLRRLLNLGLYDAWRARNPGEQRFSWWHYQGRAHDQNHGYRIDHLLLSPGAIDGLQACGMDEEERARSQASDHIPVWAEIDPPQRHDFKRQAA
ncbi:MAG: exodeoxyribonuclease III [Geminicoccaceae bacterium]